MKGFSFSAAAGTMTFGDGDREALAIPSGRLLQLIPDELTIDDTDLSYPDLPKGSMKTHIWQIVQNLLVSPNYAFTETGRAFITATPQEYSTTGILAAVPTGCDVFVGRLKATRTAAPSHGWLGASLAILCPEDEWIDPSFVPFEAGLGFMRALHVYMSGGNLIWHIQQSLGDAPGGYGNHPGNPGGEPSSIGTPFGGGNTRNGGETVNGGVAGWPIYYPGDTGAPHYRTRSYLDNAFAFSVQVPQLHRASGGTPPTLADATNMASTWRFDLRGQFGRRT